LNFQTVVTWFEQFAACFFSAELGLPTVLSCDYFSKPDVSRERWHLAGYSPYF